MRTREQGISEKVELLLNDAKENIKNLDLNKLKVTYTHARTTRTAQDLFTENTIKKYLYEIVDMGAGSIFIHDEDAHNNLDLRSSHTISMRQNEINRNR